MDQLIQKIKILQSIDPDADFLARSRRIILASPQKSSYLKRTQLIVVNFLKISFALALMVVMMLSVTGRLIPVPGSLLANQPAPSFNIRLSEARYHQEINNQINLALKKIISDDDYTP